MEAAYPTCHQQHPHDSLSQGTTLAIILRHAIIDELELDSMKGLVLRVTGNVPMARGYPSQADNTLDTYQGGKNGRKAKGGRRPTYCWGCKSSKHVFSRNGKITCPRGHDPAIKTVANIKFEEIVNQPGKLTATQKRWRKHDPNLSDLTGASLKNINNQIYLAKANT